jgi:hypothetical protein
MNQTLLKYHTCALCTGFTLVYNNFTGVPWPRLGLGHAHEGRSVTILCLPETDLPMIFQKTWQGQKRKSTFRSTAPGRRLPATVAPLPACPRTVVLRLALCPSLSRVSLLCGRCLPATVAPLLACPRTAMLRLAFCSSLSRVSPFTFVLHLCSPAYPW